MVYTDIKSPYGFVAIEPTLALERELGVQFDWRPLTLNIPSYLGSARKSQGEIVASKGRSKRTWKAIKYSYMDARRYAERQGHILRGTEKIWDSVLLNVAMMWVCATARERLPEFLTYVFPLFWNRDLDIEDLAVVEACLEACGVSSAGFANYASGDGEGRAQHDALQPQLHEHGIYGVPTYVLGGEPLHGREHLPLIRWALSGREGPAPDIAYETAPSNTEREHTRVKLDVYVDFKCAGSFLALEPTLALVARTGTEIAWHPFSTAERDMPVEGADLEVIASHHATREVSKRAIHRKYAASRDVDLHFPVRTGSADLALGALTEINGNPLLFIRACFAAYWERHEDLDDPEVVRELLAASGVGHSGDLGTARERFEEAQSRAEEAGIVDAPGYRIADQIFIGRQHLPWIEELMR
ncbi:DsbA family protein [uncultured Erythrobacter sp.]|uniref:DsbA family protein n=1 Tax=uncultured Erythrobacter sp. TaxID=263913 RepID=UPI00260EB692|nr:DsbA family protein [uncultured Erythrobacter sp.]